MEQHEIISICPYLKESSESDICRLMDCHVREIRFADINFCFGNHMVCQVYRRYSDDYIGV